MGIKSIEIENFKSIKNSGVIELKDINVLVGANGSGKSNFIEFFNFLKIIADEKLHLYLNTNTTKDKDGIDNILHFGRKKSKCLSGKISFYKDDIEDGYIFSLVINNDNRFVFNREEGFCNKIDFSNTYLIDEQIGSKLETSLRIKLDSQDKRNRYILTYIDLCKIYHFNDTSMTSNIKTPSKIYKEQLFSEEISLEEDGRNIALFLYNFSKKYPEEFKALEQTIKSVVPFFDKFYLVTDIKTDEIYLRWIEDDTIFPASSLSDGTLRFICLASILIHPIKPMTIILDEPELGLHPFAIEELASLIHIASEECQIILSTQSIDLIAQFSADDIIVVNRKNNETFFKRQNEEDLKEWLEDYSIGEIWNKNVIGGNP